MIGFLKIVLYGRSCSIADDCNLTQVVSVVDKTHIIILKIREVEKD